MQIFNYTSVWINKVIEMLDAYLFGFCDGAFDGST